ncbi:carboxy terminal-processing peptidase [Schlesneria paludicola]|uniref:carboxy terminal-processing peptidase n=1 Tax=Schlesneria paludicola TaxID=360056 RepID=UPI00029A5F22|nr:carboxy terminal-processing peptidase [Schlesneria paludicola]
MKLHAPSRTVGVLSVGVVFLVATTLFAQNIGGAQSSEATTVKLVANMISQYHISQKPLDDRISAMILQRFIKELDPQKMYFLKADIDGFARYRDQLDNLLRSGDAAFAHEAWNLYLRRLDERVTVANRMIDEPHDYSLDESMQVDGEQMSWSVDQKELNDRWRKRIKYELLSLQLDKTELAEARKRLHKRYETFRRNEHDTEDGEVLERFLTSVAHCYDPHSSYMSPQTLEDFQIQMKLSLEGIGAALRSEDGMTVVAQIVPGGAAEKDGRLKVGDKIVAVGQEDGDFQDVVEMRLNRVVRLIRGKLGTKVRLRILRDAGETVSIELTRQTIELHSSEVKGKIFQPADFGLSGKGRVGVINIPSFYRDFSGAQQGKDDFKSTARDVSKVLGNFAKEGGVDAIIIDLRMNGGGALSEAIEVTGLFIDKGPVVQVKEQNGNIKSHDDEEDGAEYLGPLMVVCNRLSASASEIFAAAIKDYGRGIVVGDTTTHGKGTVQNVMPVSNQMFKLLPSSKDRGALKLTINQFYRVNGDSTQNRGVESDVVLPSLIDHMDLGESFMDNALAFDRVQPARHQYLKYVTPEIVSVLKTDSEKRVAADPKFQQTLKDIDRYLARKSRKSVSLNEETLRKEREEDKAAKEVEKEEEEFETKSDKTPVLAKTEYNTELMAIAVEYAGLLKAQKTAANR